MILILQRGARDAPTDGLVQTHKAPQGFNLLHGVDSDGRSYGHRQQRQDRQTHAIQRRSLQPRRYKLSTYFAYIL